jgi:hypothetical protein
MLVTLNNFSAVFSQENDLNKLIQQSEFIAPAATGVNIYKPIIDPVSNRRKSGEHLEKPKKNALQSKPVNLNPDKLATKTKIEFDSLLTNSLEKKIDNNVDNNEYSKIEPFDAREVNFERFKNSPCYDKIGFNPTNDIDSMEKEYQDCESRQVNNWMNVIYIIVFLIVICGVVIFSFSKKESKSDN